MPNIKSAIKRVKVAEKKTLENSRIKSAYKTAVKKYESANENGDKSAVELLKVAKQQLDHAFSKGVISKNAASRKKSRLDKKLAVNAEGTSKKEVAPKAEKKVAKKAAPKTTAKKTATKKTATKKTTKKAE